MIDTKTTWKLPEVGKNTDKGATETFTDKSGTSKASPEGRKASCCYLCSELYW